MKVLTAYRKVPSSLFEMLAVIGQFLQHAHWAMKAFCPILMVPVLVFYSFEFGEITENT
ncbi:hypothetical protein [Shewanella sp. FDAARGOS_354]|uniref:hypothetical protein n=1 Tax=Shewanella sp. FDAARGOS_354 TaxID=1930557 RepID=UPI001868E576|nr:hypothetical protein [Shewanella sp. FDAARGOS_354]